jgi:hypothetical protein
VVSPILSSIYLYKLDSYVETVLIPQHTRGARRAPSRAHDAIRQAIARARRRGDRAKARQLGRQLRTLPSQDSRDPGYRRLRYSRYADDHLLGFTGPKAEAEQIRDSWRRSCATSSSWSSTPAKPLITHARTRAARYLGYEIIAQHDDSKITRGRRSVNGVIALRVPRDVITAKCAPYLRHGKPEARTALCNLDDYDIVAAYGAEYRGIVQYYLLATDVWRLARLRWAAETSMLKTLAAKHSSTVTAMAARHKAKIETPRGIRTCFEARVETRRQAATGRTVRRDTPRTAQGSGPHQPRPRSGAALPRQRADHPAPAGPNELCEEPAKVQVHQIRKLAQLDKPGPGLPPWAVLMARKRRKTLVVCHPCHDAIHHRQPTATTA